MEQEHKYLIEKFAEATEWQLATLEMLQSRKGSSKSDLRRQESICFEMVQICKSYKPEYARSRPRLNELLGLAGWQ